jgi:hypothetical protein
LIAGLDEEVVQRMQGVSAWLETGEYGVIQGVNL